MNTRLILASDSPRRKRLLEQAGLIFDVVPGKVDEKNMAAGSPEDYARRLAEAKADVVARQYPNAHVIGADTIVVIEGMILGKPASKLEARDMLKRLSGRNHAVLTGYAIRCDRSTYLHSETIWTRVRFKSLTNSEIEWYLGTNEPYDKAGSYAIQGQGAFMVKEIAGSYTNVVGLPMSELIDCLNRIDVVVHLRK
jgi:septum formation protein